MKVFSENRKAGFDYEILEKLEAGIVLNGQEVKSIKLGRAHLAGSYVSLKNGVPELIGLKIPPYQPLNCPKDYNEGRNRQLLLHRKEANYLIGKSEQKGLTFVPLKLYTNKAKIKLEFGIAKGKKKASKKESIKKREIQRGIERAIKGNYHGDV